MNWLEDMRREAVGLAFPTWAWQDGDEATVVVFGEYDSEERFLGFGIAITAARPGTDSEMVDTFTGEEATEFMHKLLGSTTW